MRKPLIVWVLPLLLLLLGSLQNDPGRPTREGALFTEITDQVKLDFIHDPGKDGTYFMPEIMGGGGAFLDYDNDGDLDIYLIQAGPHTEGTDPKPNRLFRQEADGTFRDVSAESGLGDTGYGMGVAVGDIDNDGYVDIYVSNYGPDVLYRNDGRGGFENVSASGGISDDAWSASAVFCDYDNDGYLDLYVAHYLSYDPSKQCRHWDGSIDYCGPGGAAETDVLYQNNGDGTFTDVSRRAGIHEVSAPGLGVYCQDLTGDGRLDFYVANDGKANQLWVNQGNGRFIDEAYMLGVALNSFGAAEAGMGIAAGDVDGDSEIDLFLTHLNGETNTLYLSEGGSGFRDATAQMGLAFAGLQMTGFGTAFLDYDHDGDLDIAVANGRVKRQPLQAGSRGDPYWRPYAEPNLLLRNTLDSGEAKFEAVGPAAGEFSSLIEVSRGLALGDVDNDGDLDLLVTHLAGPARLFRNDAPKRGRWLKVRAFDPANHRDAHGAVVTIVIDDRRITRPANPGFSYLSSNAPGAHFGLPSSGTIGGIVIRWPDGSTESFAGVAPDQTVVLRKGEGETIR